MAQRSIFGIPDPLGLSSWGESLQAQLRRLDLQQRVTAWFDIGLSVLALVFLALLVAEFTTALSDPWDDYAIAGQTVIWVLFVLAFAVELYLAPSALGYVRSHWLVVLSLFIPALRVFRVLNAIRVLRGVRIVRSLQLVRTSTAVRRVIQVIDEFFELSRVAYLIIVVTVLAPTGGVLLYYLERGDPNTNIDSLSEGIWYSITNIVTLEAQFVPATWEARVVSVVLRVLGMAVVGYLTAAVAVFLLGKRESPEAPARQDELRALRQEIARLRDVIEKRE